MSADIAPTMPRPSSSSPEAHAVRSLTGLSTELVKAVQVNSAAVAEIKNANEDASKKQREVLDAFAQRIEAGNDTVARGLQELASSVRDQSATISGLVTALTAMRPAQPSEDQLTKESESRTKRNYAFATLALALAGALGGGGYVLGKDAAPEPNPITQQDLQRIADQAASQALRGREDAP